MTGTGTILIQCPAMPVYSFDPITGIPYPNGWHRTAELKANLVMTLPNGAKTGGWMKFPPTYVKPSGFLKWTVDQCRAEGFLDDGSPIWNALPPEPVVVKTRFGWPPYYLVAKQITATGGIAMRDGSQADMMVGDPDANFYRQGHGDYLVDAVEANGKVVFQ